MLIRWYLQKIFLAVTTDIELKGEAYWYPAFEIIFDSV